MAAVASVGVLSLTGVLSAFVSTIAVEQRERLGEDIRDLTAPGNRSAIKPLPTAAVLSPLPQPSAPAPAPAPAAYPARWQIQIGTFRSKAAAVEQLRSTAARLPELARYSLRTQRYRGHTRARIGGIAAAQEAHDLCTRVIEAGSGCYVVPPG